MNAKNVSEYTNSPMQSAVNVPVQKQERIDVLDILRGFALLGILIVNMRDFNSLTEFFPPERMWSSTLDNITEWFIAIFANEKFYSLFSCLFGVGFAVQMERLEKRGVGFIKVYSRRLLALFGFGVLHGVFFWWGDVLAAYAIFGFVLLLLRKLSMRVVLILSLCSMLLPIGYSTIKVFYIYKTTGDQSSISEYLHPTKLNSEEKSFADRFNQMYSKGSYHEIFIHRVNVLFDTYKSWLYRSYGAQVLGMFLFGLFIGKSKFLLHIGQQIKLVKQILLYSTIGIGSYTMLFLTIKLVTSNEMFVLNLITFELGKIMRGVFVLFYSTVIILLFQNHRWKTKLLFLAQPGRMALTNYIMQSVLCTLIFYSYGFGLYGTISPFQGVILTIGIFCLQIVASNWWLKYYRFGPLEWIWRSLTYGSVQPTRIQRS